MGGRYMEGRAGRPLERMPPQNGFIDLSQSLISRKRVIGEYKIEVDR
jgi:hypothetical protein